MTSLPIDPLLPQICDRLRTESRLVLRAEPGAGKTTRVPAALLDAGLSGGKDIVVLEPRRIAARSAAEFVSRERGGNVGGEVGYRVRFEQRGSAATRLWFVTEGVFGRQLSRDPFLESVGVVVLDEFHERHLQGDVALAVVRELQQTVRPDLLLVVMSATLDTASVAAYLDDCPVISSPGRAYPVTIEYEPTGDDRPLAGRIVTAVRRIVQPSEDSGDVLVFLPGAAEISRATAALEPLAVEHRFDVVPLHGDLTLEAQTRAIRRGPRRKIVLSTNVAETALTIEGVTTVIDSGLARVSVFDAKHGINTLRTQPISRSSTDQRAGRAGRLSPGRCLRLWTEPEQKQRRPHETPEILRLDLSATMLELRAWGLRDLRTFRWLDAPRDGAIERAERLLQLLGAINAATGDLTEIGTAMLRMPVDPRLARMLVEAQRQDCVDDGALLAALASERDILAAQRFGGGMRKSESGASDLLQRLELFRQVTQSGDLRSACQRFTLDPRTVRTVQRTAEQLRRVSHTSPSNPTWDMRRQASSEPRGAQNVMPAITRRASRSQSDGFPPKDRGNNELRGSRGLADEHLLRCIAAGFPDRLVRRRAALSSRGVMVGGRGVILDDASVVREADLFVAIEIDGGARRDQADALVRIASEVHRDWLARLFPESLRKESVLELDADRGRVIAVERTCFHDLVLSERSGGPVDRERAGEILAGLVRANPEVGCDLAAINAQLLDRLRFLRRAMPVLEIPDPELLLGNALEFACTGKVSLNEVRQADVAGILLGLLPPAHRHALEREAPAVLPIPSGRTARIDYGDEKGPVLSARIQELFGLAETPRLAGGTVPVVLQLLAPNQRPVQSTADLASFWRTTYVEVRKQLRGRYPKHDWPEDPYTAVASAKLRRR